MKEIRILDKKFREMISQDAIQERISQLAQQINNDFRGKEVLFVGILNGAFMFAADMFKRIDLKASISFIKLASYHGTNSTGEIKELIGWNEEITGKNVIILEDIVDTGMTLEGTVHEIVLRKAALVRVASLLLKPDAFTGSIPIDYLGFEIPNNFVVGYGLDYNGYGRNLTSIYSLVR
jgi:hypoxanthine phosphoribosyltransferase